ncbi:MAG: hypothetical protein K9M57_04155 [Phycisphaerae bacterium]|nr:hypothetical protein [Phycisphaerae bacterium]
MKPSDMNKKKKNDASVNYDELISSTYGRNELKFDFDQWKQDHADVVREYQSKTKNITEGPRQRVAVWRLIMKSRISKYATSAIAASILIAVFISINRDNTLYGQVIRAMEKARTIYAVSYRVKNGESIPGAKIYYQKGTGFRIDSTHKGKTRTHKDNGKFEWNYTEGNDFAVQSESSAEMKLPREITDPGHYLKNCTREAKGDKTVDGQLWQLHVSYYPEASETVSPRVKNMLWIDEAMRLRRFEEKNMKNGQWETVEIGEITYNEPIDKTFFEADFGPNVEILKPQDGLAEKFSLDKAIATKEVLGFIFFGSRAQEERGCTLYNLFATPDRRNPGTNPSALRLR